jgi:RNA polymerase sigma-70 factor (ECF subfamily)
MDAQTDHGLPAPYRPENNDKGRVFKDDHSYFSKRALRLGTKFDDVDDVMQQFWIRIELGWSTFDRAREYRTWANEVLNNVVLDYHRYRTRAKRDDRRNCDLDTELTDDSSEQQRLPVDVLEDLRNCFGLLSGNIQQTIRLRYFNSLSLAAIAEIFDVKVTAISMRLERGRQRIKTCMEAKGYGKI